MSDSESDHYQYSDSGSESDSGSDSDSDDESSAAAAAPKTTADNVKKAFLARQKARQKARHASKAHFVQHTAAEHVLNPSASNATISDEQKAAIEKRMIRGWFKDSLNLGRWGLKFATIQAAEALLNESDPRYVQKKQDIEYLKGLLIDRCKEAIKREQERQAAQELRDAQEEYTRLEQKDDMKSMGKTRYLKRKYPDLELLKRLAQLNF